MTQITTVFEAHIALKDDTEMSTGYIGRGQSPKTKVFPAGTTVRYQRLCFKGDYVAHDGDEITRIKHIVSVIADGHTYSAVKEFLPK